MDPTVSHSPAASEEAHMATKHILLRDSVEAQSVHSGLLSTLSFWLHYAPLSKTQGMNRCIIGVITSVGDRGVSPAADYIILLVHLPLTGGAPPPATKRQSTPTIQSYSLTGGGGRRNPATTAFSQTSFRLTAAERTHTGSHTGCRSAFFVLPADVLSQRLTNRLL